MVTLEITSTRFVRILNSGDFNDILANHGFELIEITTDSQSYIDGLVLHLYGLSSELENLSKTFSNY